MMSDRDDLSRQERERPRRVRAPKTAGRRTTLRVPEELDGAARRFATALGTTPNDALVLLAQAGANELARRQVQLERSRELVARFEAEDGPIEDDLLAEVDRLWPE